jgi:hypothetical protein
MHVQEAKGQNFPIIFWTLHSCRKQPQETYNILSLKIRIKLSVFVPWTPAKTIKSNKKTLYASSYHEMQSPKLNIKKQMHW